jgi:ABC-type transport system involved in multi-copper enzyme maturation permease subunit
MQKPARRRPFGTLLKFDLRYALSSARGLLFLTMVVVVWGWILSKLASGFAERAHDPQIGMVMSFFLDGATLSLLQDQPATLSVFFIVAMSLTPFIAIVGSCDQTAGDLATKHLRFLIPRVGRNEIFFARFTGAAILVTATQLLAAIGGIVVQLKVGGYSTSAVLAFGAQVAAALVLYSLAFVALSSIVCAGLASVGLALITALGGYVLLIAIASFVSMSVPAAAYTAWLLPTGVKPQLMQTEMSSLLVGLAVLVAYAAAYLGLGRFVFHRRDA